MSRELVKITVNLTPSARRAMEMIAELCDATQTEAINRALNVYAFLEEQRVAGKDLLLRSQDRAELELVRII